MNTQRLILYTVCSGAFFSTGQAQEKPNIVLIMCDDMGFSDISSYGGELLTPHLDELSKEGICFTQFKNTGRSCPSRAALLTGRYQHSAGMGWMTAVDEHRESYRGQLTGKYPTIAEVLRDGGYATYMSGKWHLTLDRVYEGKDSFQLNGSFPVERGFDQYWGAISGGGSYYAPAPLMKNGQHIKTYPEGFYYTTEITKHAVEFIENHDTNKPLFLYVAHFAPHRPWQAPKERIDKCRKRYEVGYDVLREQRFKRMKELGLIPDNQVLPIHQKEFKNHRLKWEEQSPSMQEKWIENMATYAAMVEMVDDGVGEIIEATKQKGIYENTIFIFLSDNGCAKEGGIIPQYVADLSNFPYRNYKVSVYNGGTSSPLIIHYPKKYGNYAGQLRTTPAHIMDLLPTCIDLAGISYPHQFKGKPIPPCEGVSLVPVLRNKSLKKRDLFFEHGSCAVISDGWKLIRSYSKAPWELYKLDEDPFEMHDLSKQYPRKVEKLLHKWDTWAEKHHVHLEGRGWDARIKYYSEKYPDQDGID